MYSISCQWFLSVLDMTWMGRRCEGVWGCMYMQPVALDQLLCSMLGLSARASCTLAADPMCRETNW